MQKPIRIAFMSYAMDIRPEKGTAINARQIIQGFVDDLDFDCSLVPYDKVDLSYQELGLKRTRLFS